MYLSFSFTPILAAVFLLLLSYGVRSQVVLEAVKCRPQFPTGIDSMSSIYGGEGRIYVFGGLSFLGGGESSSIYLYDVSSDTLTRVGALLNGTQGNALAKDSQGNLYHFGGFAPWTYLDTINRFNTSSNVTELVGRLPQGLLTRGTVKVKADIALVFGYQEILQVDLRTYQVTEVGATGGSGVAWDGRDRVLLFGYTQHQVYSISGNNVTTDFTSSEPHDFTLHHSVISTPKSAWIVGNQGSIAGRGNGLFEVDFETLEFKFWPVVNYPAGNNGNFNDAATTYVPELHRLYMFGGYSSSGGQSREVWYIDLPGGNVVTTTTSTTTTSPSTTTTPTTTPLPTTTTSTTTTTPTTTTPAVTTTPATSTSTFKPCGHAQCPPFVDGNFPDPQDCTGFVSCVAGRPYCNDCPPGLYYHIENNECDYPHNVDCGSRPIP